MNCSQSWLNCTGENTTNKLFIDAKAFKYGVLQMSIFVMILKGAFLLFLLTIYMNYKLTERARWLTVKLEFFISLNQS